MYHYEFYGQTNPKGINLTLFDIPEVKIKNKELNIFGNIKFECINSDAKIFFSSEKRFLDEFLPTVRNIVCEYGRFFIDTYSYIRSINCELEIIGIRCKETGLDKKFSIQLETDLEKDLSKISDQFDEIVTLISGHENLFFLGDVFADFRRAIKYPKMSAGFFYRAVETIRGAYFKDNNTQKEWNRMNSNLKLQESDYEDLIKFSKKNRHGQYPSITAEQRLKLAKDTRRIIDSFIEYVKSNQK